MQTYLLSLTIFISLFLIGGIVLCLLLPEYEISKNHQLLFLAPILGAVSVTCICETFVIFAAMRYACWFTLIFLAMILLLLRKKYTCFIHTFFNHSYLDMYSALCLYLCYPTLGKTGFISARMLNNDLIFYLSDMDWFMQHTLRAIPNYTPQLPYYFLTYNMQIRGSRIGTDLLGCFFRGVFSLESSQIFYALGIALTIALIATSVFVFRYILKGTLSGAILLFVTLSFSVNLIMLNAMQYIPQIFGMGIMISLFGTLAQMYIEKSKSWCYLSSLFIAGAICVYTEFIVHIFIIFVITLSIAIISSNNNTRRLQVFVFAVVAGFSSILICFPGILRSVYYIWFLLTSGTKNIDPLSGLTLMSYGKLLRCFWGFQGVLGSEAVFKNFETITAIILIIISLYCIITVVKKNLISYQCLSLSLIACCFLLYELYFRLTNFKYGEAKHITAILPFLWIICVYYVDITLHNIITTKSYLAVRKVAIIITLIICMLNIITVITCYPVSAYSFYDNELLALKNQSSMLPKNLIIRADYSTCDNSYDRIHKILYALQNIQICIKGNSYYSDIVNKDFSISNSVLYDKELDCWQKVSGDMLYNSQKYIILKDH